MPTSLTNLFNFGRPLPKPFDKLPSKKVKGFASRYGGTEATLCASIIKAVHALCVCPLPAKIDRKKVKKTE